MEIHPSALKHDVTAADVEHAVRNSMAVDEVADDPVRFMVLGPDTAGRMLEIDECWRSWWQIPNKGLW